jgi:hypothetical protein
MTDGPRHDDGQPDRAERSLASRIVWVVLILVVLAGLLFGGFIVAIALVQGDPYRPSLQIENQTDQTLMVYRVVEGTGERAWLTTISPHASVSSGDDCGSAKMLAITRDGTEIARRGPFKLCNLDTWVIREISGT